MKPRKTNRCRIVAGLVVNPKRCYDSEAIAKRNARRIKRETGRDMKWYYCKVHGKWRLATKE